MLNKLLFKNQDFKQLIIAMLGSLLGITFLLCSIHYLIKVNEFGEGNDILGPNTIIVQKKVTTANTLNMAKTDFSPEEIDILKQEKFILDVKPVISNSFDVSFQTADPMVPYFRSNVFIQTVDQSFLDVKSDKWHWKEGDTLVPIILPRDFLVMLNTFMSASGIPQISDELAMDVKFKFRLSGEGQPDEYIYARIIGFTNEVASILVPATFMEYGNKKFAGGVEQKITQVMISGTEAEFGLVEQLLKEKHLESKNSQMVVGRLKSTVGTLILVVLGISVLAVFLSGLVLIQYAQLLMSKNAYQIRTLLRLGYAPQQLIRSFFGYFVKIFGWISLIGCGLFFALKYFLDRLFEEGGLYIDTGMTWISIGALLLAYVFFSLASYLNARKGIYREF
ncbi:MAG: ABC transporter permease [Bacteroidetes bacterium]|nr:MAG: ABC transporter permease [Bacteroidota bacterium]